MSPPDAIVAKLTACRICADRFAKTATAHRPRPVVWVRPGARLLIAGQAPGARVHASGLPFDDRSGDRLRDWLGLDRATFYDRDRVAIAPMGFCFPGYSPQGADLPPPRICARTWRAEVMEYIGPVGLTVVIGTYAMGWHIGPGPMRDHVANWRAHAPALFPLPHPSWRNTAWLRRNPWFETQVLPALRARVTQVLDAPPRPG